jgi:hypothetical protein
VENRLPAGVTWSSFGGNGSNIRVGAVYLAEAAHRLTGARVATAYFVLDTVTLFCALLILFIYLQRWIETPLALLGVLYVCAVLPLTYALHFFHPWDRLSLLSWIVALHLLRDRRLFWFALALVVDVVVKYDIVLLPGLYWLAFITRANWRSVTLKTSALFAVSFGTFAVLRVLLPGGFEPRHFGQQLSVNLHDLAALRLAYPPLLGFAVPVALAAIGFRQADSFARSSALFAALLCIPLVLATNFQEFRAEMPILILLLPAALVGCRALLAPDDTVAASNAVSSSPS